MRSIKQRLADRVNKDLNLTTLFEAKDFNRNRGANRFNDWCSWTARSGSNEICSWNSMTELLKKKDPLVFIGKNKGIGEIG
jgi:hypothetical protein